MKSIVIAGDSYGVGEWGHPLRYSNDLQLEWEKFYNVKKKKSWPDCPKFEKIYTLPTYVWKELNDIHGFVYTFYDISQYYCLHKGLEQYFTDIGHSVINLSSGGRSNYNSISDLTKQQNLNDCICIWIQTDPFRDFRDGSFLNEAKTYEHMIEMQQTQLYKTYQKLNHLNQIIYCIGGCSKLDLALLENFNNLIPVAESLLTLIDPTYTHPEFWFSSWYKDINRHFSIDDLDKLLYNKLLQDSLADRLELFWPDGGHPNRHGYKKAFTYIYEFLKKHEDIFRRT